VKINISIDDVSPHPLSSVRVLDRCEEIIKKFPDAKFTLFVPIAYWRTIKPGIRTPEPLVIKDHPEFCEKLRRLSPNSYEVCYHGFYHGIPGKSDNDEFQYLSYEEAFSKFEDMKYIVAQAGLADVFQPIFRPPAWRMSRHAIRAARDCGIRTLALSAKDHAKKTYEGEDEKFESVVYYDCNPPFDPLVEKQKNEIVYHACEWDKNHLGEDLTSQLIDWLFSRSEKLEFCFIESLLK